MMMSDIADGLSVSAFVRAVRTDFTNMSNTSILVTEPSRELLEAERVRRVDELRRGQEGD